jgi:hypothetical protein
MSYDVWLEIDTGGPERASITQSRNMTSNVAPVWRAAFCDVALFDEKQAGDCVRHLVRGLDGLRRNPRSFDNLVRGDGSWGTVESAIEFLEGLLADFRAHPKCTVRVSR